MDTEVCPWTSIYDENKRIIMGIGIIVSASMSVFLSGTLVVTLSKNRFRLIKECTSHLMLLNLCLGFICRSLSLTWFGGASVMAGRWIFGESNCQIYGFLAQFLFVYQIESLTHMCIERYVVAKYSRNGWHLKRSQYVLFIVLCLAFSMLYSVPQLLGCGRYSQTFTCTACAFDAILPEDTLCRCVVVGIMLLQSVKPVAVIIFMLRWTRNIEREGSDRKESSSQMLLTQSTIKITSITLLFWTPGFLSLLWVVLNQILYNVVLEPPLLLITISTIGFELGPAITALSIIWTNERLRHAVMKTFYHVASYEKAK